MWSVKEEFLLAFGSWRSYLSVGETFFSIIDTLNNKLPILVSTSTALY